MVFSWLPGRARTSFHHSQKTVILPTRTGAKHSLAELCESATPPCHLNPLLFNGHLQTAWTIVKAYDIPIYYKRKVFESDDPNFAGTFAVDFAVSKYDDCDNSLPPRTTYFTEEDFEQIGSLDSKPMLVCLHGLSGGSHELYLRHVLAPLLAEVSGWEACVVNSRGCAQSKITSGILYNARATWDVRQVVRWLKAKFPNRPLFGVGFSLGANILTNYCGEEGESCLLKGAVVCSNPWNLEAASLALQRTWFGLEVYSKAMGSSMKRLLEEHADQIISSTRIDLDKIRKITYLHEFDREVQCPSWGYPTEGAYYRDASSCDALLNIRVPFFAINAEDDPIAVKEAIPFQEIQQNPFIVLCTTSLGGHLSWMELGGGRWFAKPVTNFLKTLAEDIDLEALSNSFRDIHLNSYNPPKGLCFEPVRRKMHRVDPTI
ncbi:hydrolase, alpha/beta fold family [Xylona heveae TC161]|uniref:alcohol O-acetyltransferase n=1 Tax=Xylona heveae (strain CBS 132557 / TC161) TaxID=1328760 RepID=A0A165FS57_XYLHT|nr:hydrolase, alpha/beta fold family [Xylona heveae TC161]KZF21310.1 hydrolase, alpha/beta fold family [Xylona heveae TC161]